MLSLSQQHNPLQLSSCHQVVRVSATQPPSNCHHVIMLYLLQQHNPLPTVIMSPCCTCFSNTTPFQLSSCHHVVLVSATQPPSNCHHVTMLYLLQQHNPLPTVIMSSCCTCFSNTTPFQLSSCHHVVLASATQPPSNCHHVIMLYLFQQNNLLPIAIVSLCYFCSCLSNTTLFQLSSRHHAVFVSAAQTPSNCHHTVFVTIIQPLPFVISSSHRLCHNNTTPSICHLVTVRSQQHSRLSTHIL